MLRYEQLGLVSTRRSDLIAAHRTAISALFVTPQGRNALRDRIGATYSREEAVIAALVDSKADCRVFILDESDQVICWAEYVVDQADPTTAEFSILVCPDFQGKGVARKAIEQLFDLCTQQHPTVQIMCGVVNNDNRASFRFFQKLLQVFSGTTNYSEAYDETVFSFRIVRE